MRSKKTLIIGLAGFPGAGKTTVAKYLVKKGYVHVVLSDFIKDEVRKAGVTKFTREILQDYGNKMRERFGPQVLAQLAMKKIRVEDARKVVIDGVRNLYEVAFLNVENNFTLIGVNARPRERYRRLHERQKYSREGTFKKFLQQERREETLGSKEIGLRVQECLGKADFIDENNSSLDALYAAVDGVLLLKKGH